MPQKQNHSLCIKSTPETAAASRTHRKIHETLSGDSYKKIKLHVNEVRPERLRPRMFFHYRNICSFSEFPVCRSFLGSRLAPRTSSIIRPCAACIIDRSAWCRCSRAEKRTRARARQSCPGATPKRWAEESRSAAAAAGCCFMSPARSPLRSFPEFYATRSFVKDWRGQLRGSANKPGPLMRKLTHYLYIHRAEQSMPGNWFAYSGLLPGRGCRFIARFDVCPHRCSDAILSALNSGGFFFVNLPIVWMWGMAWIDHDSLAISRWVEKCKFVPVVKSLRSDESGFSENSLCITMCFSFRFQFLS